MMARPLSLKIRTEDPNNILASFIPHYGDYLAASRYSKARRYLATVIHFGRCLRPKDSFQAKLTKR